MNTMHKLLLACFRKKSSGKSDVTFVPSFLNSNVSGKNLYNIDFDNMSK